MCYGPIGSIAALRPRSQRQRAGPPRVTRRHLSVCAHPGCPELTPTTRCDEHRPPDRRPPSSQRGYSGEWRKVRAVKLDRDPSCERCGAPATDVDHDPPLADLVAAGVADPHADRWLHSLCHSCHSRKTATQDGGFGRRLDYQTPRGGGGAPPSAPARDR